MASSELTEILQIKRDQRVGLQVWFSASQLPSSEEEVGQACKAPRQRMHVLHDPAPLGVTSLSMHSNSTYRILIHVCICECFTIDVCFFDAKLSGSTFLTGRLFKSKLLGRLNLALICHSIMRLPAVGASTNLRTTWLYMPVLCS